MIQQPPPSTPNHFPTKLASGLAITSMVCGLVSFIILIIPSFVAIICGHMARG